MSIEIKLFGFGDDRPAGFGDKNLLQLEIATPTTPRKILQALGIDDSDGIVVMTSDQVIPTQQWDASVVRDRDQLTLLSAFEGG